MQAAFSKLKLKSKASDIPQADSASTSGKPPSTKQIYQSRQNFGVNFGACFVLEKWIYHELFSETNGDAELDAVLSLFKSLVKMILDPDLKTIGKAMLMMMIGNGFLSIMLTQFVYR